MVHRVALRDVTPARPDHDCELNLPIDLSGDVAIDLDGGVRADDGRGWLGEEDRMLRLLLGHPELGRFGGVGAVVEAEAEDVATWPRDRRQQGDAGDWDPGRTRLKQVSGTSQRGRPGLNQ